MKNIRRYDSNNLEYYIERKYSGYEEHVGIV